MDTRPKKELSGVWSPAASSAKRYPVEKDTYHEWRVSIGDASVPSLEFDLRLKVHSLFHFVFLLFSPLYSSPGSGSVSASCQISAFLRLPPAFTLQLHNVEKPVARRIDM